MNDLLHSEIDSCKYLYLREIGEPRDNQLRVVVEEADASPFSESRKIAGATFTELHPIESGENSRLFDIIWENHIAYDVMNESYARVDNYDVVQSGKLMRIYSGHISLITLRSLVLHQKAILARYAFTASSAWIMWLTLHVQIHQQLTSSDPGRG